MGAPSKAMVACVQLDSQDNEEENWTQIVELCKRAARCSVDVIALPENMLYEGRELLRKHDVEGLWKPRLQALAKELDVAIVAGTVREPTEDAESPKSYNTCLAIDAAGEERGRYRKIHLFDIDLENGPRHKESDYLAPGIAPVACDLAPLGRVGLTICYDVRFPELFRHLARHEKVETLFVPASFTMATGKDHWDVLLRARAIENQCFVIAPNQCGTKGKRMQKYGRSVIIDPWGTVLARAADGPSFCIAELDFRALRQFRRSLPIQQHTRLMES
jgi:deaminated glutathione amidase